MPGKRSSKKPKPAKRAALPRRAIYCGDCLDQLAKLPDGCVDLIYIAPSYE